MVSENSVAVPTTSVIMASGRHDLCDQLQRKALTNSGQAYSAQSCQNQDKIALLAGRLIGGQEAERKRISRELHDGLGQDIAALGLKIDILLMRSAVNGVSGLELEELRHEVALLGHKVRLISHNLHPAMLERVGLAAALNGLCNEFQHEGLRIRRVLPKDGTKLQEQTQLCLFRVAQEALRNVVRHARCNFAYLKLQQLQCSTMLTIKDHGAGFDCAEKRCGLGLISMQERVRLVQGSFEVQSAPGCGTRIRVTVPSSDAA